MFSKDTTIDDVINNPEAYGAPSFEQFKNSPEKYRNRGKSQTVLDTIDNGSQNLKQYIIGVEYEVFGHKVKTAVEAEKIARDHGYKVEELNMKGEIFQNRDDVGGKCRVLFRLEPTVDARIRVQMQEASRIIT